MNNNFTEAARAEAERRTRPPGISGQTLPSMEQFAERDGYRRGFTDAAEWARTHLAAQEPTDAEVEAAARAICVGTEAGDLAVWGPETQRRFRSAARAALSAARAARRDEKDRP